MNSTVSFKCCDTELSTSFSGDNYNYHTLGCEKCGTLFEISRPRVEVRTNLTRADKTWLENRGFKTTE